MRKWTEKEVSVLRELYGKVPTKEIAKKLDRTARQVQDKANDLGLASWTEEQLKVLRENAGKRTVAELAQMLDKYPIVVARKLKELGLEPARPPRRERPPAPPAPRETLCRDICDRMKEVGVAFSGQKLYLCPKLNITVGEEAIPLPECRRG
jgi:predicted transcriptional regulator